MMIAAWVLFLALFTVAIQKFNSDDRQSQHVDPSGKMLLELSRDAGGHYWVDGYIEQVPVTFLLDTGASDVVIPADIAKQLSLPTYGEQWAQTAAGKIRVKLTRLQQMSVGGIVLKGIPASINPKMDGNTALLGMSALRHLNMHQQGDVLRLSAN